MTKTKENKLASYARQDICEATWPSLTTLHCSESITLNFSVLPECFDTDNMLRNEAPQSLPRDGVIARV